MHLSRNAGDSAAEVIVCTNLLGQLAIPFAPCMGFQSRMGEIFVDFVALFRHCHLLLLFEMGLCQCMINCNSCLSMSFGNKMGGNAS